ncbi:MAG TPA: hypothetical protein PKB07_05535 [Flavilitoribacter sp.]|nr:hypothetical protein [Flavilitoribacter sp.]
MGIELKEIIGKFCWLWLLIACFGIGLPIGVLFLAEQRDYSNTEWIGSFAVASVIVLGVFSVAVLGLAAWGAYLEHLKKQAEVEQERKNLDNLLDRICKEIRRFPPLDKPADKPAGQKGKRDEEKIKELIELIKSTRKYYKTEIGATEAEQKLLQLFEDLKKQLFPPPAQEETTPVQADTGTDKDNTDSKNS